jgi:hypothetical protein
MIKYNLAKMLEEIKRDEGGEPVAGKKKVLTQDEIKAMARGRRRKPGDKPSDK